MNKDLKFKTAQLKTTDEIEGKVEAVFSKFNEIDSDNDVVLPGSIKSGFGDKGVAMVWAHDWKDVIGRGEIEQDKDKAVFKGQFIMDTQKGRDAYNVVKAMGDLQQWSFGFEIKESENGMFKKDSGDEQEVRFLKDVRVWEVSPVLVGANQNTHTLAVKQENKEPLGNDLYSTIQEAEARAIELGCSGYHEHEQDGVTVYMPCDNMDDYTRLTSEEHQDAEEGELTLISASNTDLESGSLEKGLTFQDEVNEVLITLVALVKRAKELTALRVKKEKTLSEKSVSALTELQDEIQNVFQDIDTLLTIAGPESDEVDSTTLLLETEKVLMETLDETL